MARSNNSTKRQRQDKGTYGSKLSTPMTSKSKSPTKSSSLDRKQRKIEAAAKKSNRSKNEDYNKKPTAKTKHHVAKFSKNSIKQRVHAASAVKSSHRNDYGADCKRRKRRKTNNKPQRIDFQMNLPDSNHNYYLRQENVPWYKAETQDRFRDNYTLVEIADGKVSADYASKTKEEAPQLPSNAVLSHIDSEIQSFVAYVKLTPSERRARDAFLSHIEEILIQDFAHGGNRGRRKNEDEKSIICVEPFGSYATQEVCTFASDVDMCLWGLVKEEEERVNSHLKFVSSDDIEAEDVAEAILTNSAVGECPLLTESSLLRTMDAIQSAQKESIGQQCGDGDRKPAAVEKVLNSSEIADAPIDSLFVIDRIGVNMDTLEEESPERTSEVDEALKSSEAQPDISNAVHTNNASSQSSKVNTKSAQKNKNVPKEQFQFAIDLDGVQQLGGDPKDLPGFTEMAESQSETLHHSTESMASEEKLDAKSEKVPAPEGTDESSKPQQNATAVAAAAPNGKSLDDAIDVDDESSVEDEAIVLDDESADEADKLDSFYSRQQDTIHSPPRDADHAGLPTTTSEQQKNIRAPNRQDNDIISIGGSSDDSEYGNVYSSREDEVLELSVTSNLMTNLTDSSKPIVKPSFGPTGKTRVRVISVLQGLTSHLRRSSFTNTVECRSRARVPIVNCNTRTGFEGDIAIGGHNGVDTSTYAKRQVNRFQSFASIVLILKVLMVQQSLDKPFTGGLGSYKLYVLVAHHIENHLANGGNDRPSEVLISLLFRYSCIRSFKDGSTTDLESIRNGEGLIASDDGVCDLAPVFRIPDVVEMFRECHERLFDRILLAEGFDDGVGSDKLSYLSSMIDCFRLKEARESSDRRSRIADDITRPVGRDHPGKVNASRRVGKVFTKNEYSNGPKRSIPTSFLDHGSNKRRLSYNDTPPKRGPRGGLVPLHRPDVAAMKTLRSNPETELLLRGTKNRKNKKKQMRDEALRVFSRRSI
ncbi:hypothetical protein ACHAXN_006569 [Cyclotella atomus]